MRLSPADNVVIYSSLSIKNIIPNQKPIIPQAPPTTRHFVRSPLCSLPTLPLSRSSLLIWHCSHTIKVPAMLRGGVAGRAEAQRHCHGKSKYYFFSAVPPSAFFSLSFGDFFYNFAGTEQTQGTTSCQLSMCVCVCLCVGCGR